MFLNKEKKPFKDLTPEQRAEYVELWLTGDLEFFDIWNTPNKWLKKKTTTSLSYKTIYRPAQTEPSIDKVKLYMGHWKGQDLYCWTDEETAKILTDEICRFKRVERPEGV